MKSGATAAREISAGRSEPPLSMVSGFFPATGKGKQLFLSSLPSAVTEQRFFPVLSRVADGEEDGGESCYFFVELVYGGAWGGRFFSFF